MNNIFTLQTIIFHVAVHNTCMCVRVGSVQLMSLFNRMMLCNFVLLPIRGVKGYQGHHHRCVYQVRDSVVIATMAESSYPSSSSGSVTETRTNRESIKVNFDKVKKFAATNFTRARQVKKKPPLTTTPPFISDHSSPLCFNSL